MVIDTGHAILGVGAVAVGGGHSVADLEFGDVATE